MHSRHLLILPDDFSQPERRIEAVEIACADDHLVLAAQLIQPYRDSRGALYTHAVVQPRHAGVTLQALRKDDCVGCAVTYVSKEQFDLSNPFDVSWWRGGNAHIASVKLA